MQIKLKANKMKRHMAITNRGVRLGSPSTGEHPGFWSRAGALEQPTSQGAKTGFPWQPGVPACVAAQAGCALYRDFGCAVKGHGFQLCFRWGSQCCSELDSSASGRRYPFSKGKVLVNSYNHPYFWIFSLPLLTTCEQSCAPPASSSLHFPVPVAGGRTAGGTQQVFWAPGAVVGLCLPPLIC